MTSPRIERQYLHFPDFGSFDEASKLATSNAEALIYFSANGAPPTFVCKGMCIQLTWRICVKCEETQTPGETFRAMINVCAGGPWRHFVAGRRFQQKGGRCLHSATWLSNVGEVVRVLRNFIGFWPHKRRRDSFCEGRLSE